MSNTIFVEGNLLDDPVVRYTQGGKCVVSFPLASNRRYTKTNGEKVETTTKFQVSVWNAYGENVAESLKKGMMVIVQGYVETENWTDKEGQQRTSLKITASDVGVSLRYARVGQVTRVSSSTASTQQAAPDQDHFGSAPAPENIPF